MFAWNPYEVFEVDPTFIMYLLNVDPSVMPKKQRPRRSTKPYVDAVKEEVKKLKQVGAIKEVLFPKWLSNTLVVKKKNEK